MKGSLKRSLLIVSFILLAGRLLQADDALEALLLKAPYSETEKQSISAVFSLTREQGVPESFIIPRLEEGLAKRVPAAKLVPVLRRELESLSRARDILTAADPKMSPESQPAAWQRAALLLGKGVSESAVAAMARASVKRWPDFRAATELYLTLASWGLDPPVALKVVIAVLNSRLPADDFGNVAALFPKGRVRYLSPRALADRIVQALPETATAEELENRVLE
ncbi:MAG: hypothetical protein JXD23_08205 [Spirochaetales bacterium]|nr:hypothetical protein [Spirochaetales bacterium]